jgi:hypothetical protein
MNYHIEEFSKLVSKIPVPWNSALDVENFNPEIGKTVKTYLGSLKKHFQQEQKKANDSVEFVQIEIQRAIGPEGWDNLQDNYENEQLKYRLVLDERFGDLTPETPKKLLMKYRPGYLKPSSKIGRAHYYAPVKKLGNLEIDTYKFNLIVIWLVSLLLYIALYYNLLRKLLEYFENLRLPKPEI